MASEKGLPHLSAVPEGKAKTFAVPSQGPPSSMTGTEVGGRRWRDSLPTMCLEDQVDSHSSFLASGSSVIVLVKLVPTHS